MEGREGEYSVGASIFIGYYTGGISILDLKKKKKKEMLLVYFSVLLLIKGKLKIKAEIKNIRFGIPKYNKI